MKQRSTTHFSTVVWFVLSRDTFSAALDSRGGGPGCMGSYEAVLKPRPKVSARESACLHMVDNTLNQMIKLIDVAVNSGTRLYIENPLGKPFKPNSCRSLGGPRRS